MGISPFSSADLFIRVLLGLRLFYQEIYIYRYRYIDGYRYRYMYIYAIHTQLTINITSIVVV